MGQDWVIMSELWSHPLFITTYALVLPAALTAVTAVFRRLGSLESQTKRLDEIAQETKDELRRQGQDLRSAMTDFRVHMAEESASVERLERLIKEFGESK
jgi:hypothetical protein